MDCGDGGVPVSLVDDEVLPEGCGAKFAGNDDRAAGEKRRKEASEEAVDVEKGHDKHSAVGRGKLVG